MGEGLKPCPLCGGRGILYELRRSDHIVQCEACGLTTAHCEIRERTRQMWNGKVRLKTWSKAVIPWGPRSTTEERDCSGETSEREEEREGSGETIELNQGRWFQRIGKHDVSVRLYNCLARAGMKSLGDVMSKSPEEIKRIKLMGPRTYRELAMVMESELGKDAYIEWEKKGAKK